MIIDERNICFYSLTMDMETLLDRHNTILLITGGMGRMERERVRNGQEICFEENEWEKRISANFIACFLSRKKNEREKVSRNTAGQTLLQFLRHIKIFLKKTVYSWI